MSDINTGDLELGGNIVLSGFSEIDRGSMVIVKKMVGTFAKRISENMPDFELLKVTVKPVHKGEDMPAKKFELKVQVIAGGKPYNSDVTDNNIFIVLDKALKKVEVSMAK